MGGMQLEIDTVINLFVREQFGTTYILRIKGGSERMIEESDFESCIRTIRASIYYGTENDWNVLSINTD